MTGILGWFGGRERSGPPVVALRVTRFRQLLTGYARLLDLARDAAVKQGGEYVFDRQFVRTLVEAAIDIAESAVFDLNVITREASLSYYEACEKLAAEARLALRAGLESLDAEDAAIPPSPQGGTDLAQAIAAAPLLYRQAGQVASRGIASAPVVNLEDAGGPVGDPRGAVLVAAGLDLDSPALALLDGAAALLLDGNSPADGVASLARQRRIPCIVRLRDASRRIRSGTVVTVDAEDSAVYAGRVEELLALGGGEEEAEYRLLRAVRRGLFELTPGSNRTAPVPSACRTLRDLVHLAHLVAGDALFGLVRAEAAKERRARAGADVVVFAADSGAGTDEGPLASVFVGMRAGGVSGAGGVTRYAAVDRDRCILLAAAHGGIDVVAAATTDLPSANFLYCRLVPSFGATDVDGWRGRIGAEVLRRIGLEVAATPREVSAWGRGMDAEELGPRLEVVGRLVAWRGGDTKGDPVGAARDLLRESGWSRR
ncbi:MAG: PEP-utilizing enzyme [Acidobacteriota bacterium]